MIVELIGELFIVELLYGNYFKFLKTWFKIIHRKNTLDNVFNRISTVVELADASSLNLSLDSKDLWLKNE